MLRIPLIAILFTLASDAGSAPAVAIDPMRSSTQLTPELRYLEDPDGQLDLGSFLEKVEQGSLKISKEESINLGFTQSPYWFVVDLISIRDHPSDHLLEINYGHLDNVKVFIIKEDQTIPYEAGDFKPFHDRVIEHRHFLFPLTLPVGEQKIRVVIRCQTSSSFRMNLRLVEKESFWIKNSTEDYIQGIYFGIMGAMIAYNFFIYFTLRTRSYFYYLIFLVTHAIMQACYLGYAFQYFWPNAPGFHQYSTTMSISWSVMSFAFFAVSFMSLSQATPRIAHLITYLAIFVGSLGIASMVMDISLVTGILYRSALPLLVVIWVAGFIRIYQKSAEAIFFIAALSMLILGSLVTSFTGMGVLPSNIFTEYAMQVGSAVEVLMLSLALARRMKVLQEMNIKIQKEANEKLETFNTQLEIQVESKTREVRDLLDHIPQGVLSIGEDGIVGDSYSAHLSGILGTKDLAGQNFNRVFLDRCDLSSDQKDQIWQTILAVVGCDSINFLANANKLPTEVTYRSPQKDKVLSITWNISEKDDEVDSILVTLLDVTSQKLMELEAKKQQDEMLKMQELLDLSETKAHKFFMSSEVLLNEIASTLASLSDPSDLNMDLARLLFVNAHTVKGAARTLHLNSLTESIHEMEEKYSDYIKGELQSEDSLAGMISDIQRTLEIFHQYQAINRDKLKRFTDITSTVMDRTFIENHYKLLTNYLSSDEISKGDLMRQLKEHVDEIAKSIFEHLPTIFQDYEDKAQKIAKDVGKDLPVFHLSLNDIHVSTQVVETLDKSMNHLLRNSLDHGIETAEERIAADKPPHGTIFIRSIVTDDGLLAIEIWDDGRGLAIDKLRNMGVEKGVLNPSASAAEASEYIFYSGTSTSQSISQVSGRGIGMTAIRDFLQAAGGSIQVDLGSEKDENPGFYNFKFILTIPLTESTVSRQAS